MICPFYIDDLVYHRDRDPDEPGTCGLVSGYCPGNQWIRVKTFDGRHRIWLRENVCNVTAELKEGPHAHYGLSVENTNAA